MTNEIKFVNVIYILAFSICKLFTFFDRFYLIGFSGLPVTQIQSVLRLQNPYQIFPYSLRGRYA